MSHYKRKNFIKKICKNCSVETSFRSFFVCKKRIKHNFYWKMKISEASYLYQIYNSKAITICPNQHSDLLRFLFTDYSLKIKKAWNQLLGHIFHTIFFYQKFYVLILHKLAKFHCQTVFTSQLIQQNVFHVSCLGI